MIYKTNSLALASALVTIGYQNRIELPPGETKATFVFEDGETNFEELATQFWNKELSGDLQSNFDNIKALKTQVYERLRH